MGKIIQENLTKGRLEAFSDGVIAIIITLMILDIKAPPIDDSSTSVETWRRLASLLPNVLAYSLSFVILGIYWVNHHQFFHIVKYTDRKLLWHNLHVLFWLSLIPMPTAFLAGHFARPEATALYGMSMVSCAAAFTVMRKYAEENGLLMENISKKVMKKVARMNILGVSLYVVSVFAGYLSVYVSYAIFALIPAMYFLPQRIEFEHE